MKGAGTMATKKRSINDFKNRMTSPVGFVATNPKTRKPKNAKKGKK